MDCFYRVRLTDEPCAYVPQTQVWIDTNFDGVYDMKQCFGDGNREDAYLIGDWDGDGRSNLAVRRGNCVYMDTNVNGHFAKKQCYEGYQEAGKEISQIDPGKIWTPLRQADNDYRAECELAFGPKATPVVSGKVDDRKKGIKRNFNQYLRQTEDEIGRLNRLPK